MNLLESLRIALRALNANKGRSALTMLGVIIGVAAVILLVAIGTGVQEEITGQVEDLGSNLLFVLPGDMTGSGGGSPMGAGSAFNVDDLDQLKRRLSDQALVIPLMQGTARLKAGTREFRSTISAANEYGGEVFGSDMMYGRMYGRNDTVTASRVAVLGATPAQELFPNQNPVGRSIYINSERFEVIGVAAEQGGSISGDADNAVYMPVTTASVLLNTKDVMTIVVKAKNPEDIDLVKAKIEQVMRPTYGSEFTVFTQEQTLGILGSLLGTLTVMLAGIAGISLLVGGIGIMNIMLVSVSERTREIGIRKAVGARTYDIMSQFVIEAILLSVGGGVFGIFIGWLGATLLKAAMPTVVTPWAVGLAFGFSAAVGIFFGVYPAYKASRLDPIEALRYE